LQGERDRSAKKRRCRITFIKSRANVAHCSGRSPARGIAHAAPRSAGRLAHFDASSAAWAGFASRFADGLSSRAERQQWRDIANSERDNRRTDVPRGYYIFVRIADAGIFIMSGMVIAIRPLRQGARIEQYMRRKLNEPTTQ
jgi:hypothetical protein